MNASRLAKASIKIPKYIERGPTDILKALASTVKHIPSEPEVYIKDDPYLIPTKPFEKRLFVASSLAGKKTARFILNKHPELFFRDDAEPKISSFLPNEEFRADMEFTEDDIKWCLENKDTANGIIAFKSLEEKQVKLSDETLLQFFELICYTNEEIQLGIDDNEYSRMALENDKQLVSMTWKTSGLASKLFNQIKENMDPTRVHSAMITGLTKYNEHASAKQVFDDFKEYHPNKPLYCCAYSSLVSSITKLNSSYESVNEAISNIVQHMEDNLVLPDLQVFNSILKCYTSIRVREDTYDKAAQLFNDMRVLGIEPSLGTYSSIIKVIAKSRSPRIQPNLITDILHHIEVNDELRQVRDKLDNSFFGIVMNMFASHLHNVSLANKLHRIYLKTPNKFTSLSFKNHYFNEYFMLIITTESLETTLKFYEEYVPSQFLPRSECYEALGEALELYSADDSIVKKIGIDIVHFKMAQYMKKDDVFRKDPEYLEALNKLDG